MTRRALVTMALLGCNPYGSESQPETQTPADSGTPADASNAGIDAGGNDGDAAAHVDASDPIVPDAGTCSVKLVEPFDSAMPIGWTKKGTGSLTSTDGLLSATANGTASASARATLERSLTGPLPKSVTLTFDVRFSNVTGNYGEGGCTLFARKSDGSYYSLFPYVSGGTVYVDDDASLGTNNQTTLGGVAVQTLVEMSIYRVRSELRDLTPTGARAIVAVENITLVDRVVSFPTAMEGITVSCGAYAAASSTMTAAIDQMTLSICE